MQNKTKQKVSRKNSSLALGQIILLVVSIVAFSYIVGQDFEVVSAQQTGDACDEDALEQPQGFSCVNHALQEIVTQQPPSPSVPASSFFGSIGSRIGPIVKTLATAAVIYVGVRWVASIFGASDDTSNALAAGAAQ